MLPLCIIQCHKFPVINNGAVAQCHAGVVQKAWLYHLDLGKEQESAFFLSWGNSLQEMEENCKSFYLQDMDGLL